MASVKFTADERTAARTAKGVLFAFKLDGEECPGFGDRLFQKDGVLTPDQAEEIGDWVRAKLKAYKSAG